eukprot:m.375608 g.375608  ORF g.375608 m.375608 type:complete len:102 (-) comp56181_c0_seq5:967-1272(-)
MGFSDPMLFGGGMLSGPKVGLSMIFGALVAFGVIAPIVNALGLTPGSASSYADGMHGWLLWPGVTLIVCDAIKKSRLLDQFLKAQGCHRKSCSKKERMCGH